MGGANPDGIYFFLDLLVILVPDNFSSVYGALGRLHSRVPPVPDR